MLLTTKSRYGTIPRVLRILEGMEVDLDTGMKLFAPTALTSRIKTVGETPEILNRINDNQNKTEQ